MPGQHLLNTEDSQTVTQSQELAGLELPDRTRVPLDNARERMIQKEAKREERLTADREFTEALGQYFPYIAEERGYEVAQHKEQ